MEKIRIFLVEDQPLFRMGLSALIRDTGELELAGEAENGKIFFERLKELSQPPDIVLLDMEMPELNGVEVNRLLQKEHPLIKVVVLSVYGQERYISKMVGEGACGYLVKNCEMTELLAAIRSVWKNGFYFNQDTLRAMRRANLYREDTFRSLDHIPITLTTREKEILQLICKEYTNAEIAEKLFLSPRTVDGYRNNLLLKTGCRNTAGLVIFAIRHGIFELGYS